MKTKSKMVRKNPTKKGKNLSTMSVDDFMSGIGEESSEDDALIEEKSNFSHKNGSVNGHTSGHIPHSDNDSEDSNRGSEEEDDEVGEESDDEDGDVNDDDCDVDEDVLGDSDGEGSLEGNESETEDSGKKHKLSLNKLKDTDPEFYKFLEENDKKLLQFNLSDSEESDEDQDEEEVHKPVDKLEVNSDDSDFEAEEDDNVQKSDRTITIKMVRAWREKLQTDKSVQTISDVVQAFHAALQRIVPESEKEACMFKVDGSAVFNSVVQMCVLDLLPALRSYLKLPPGTLSRAEPHKCKRWSKVKTLVKSYIVDLLRLLSDVASVNISTILLKHMHQMTPFITPFANVTKNFLKKMISIWGTGEETVRVIAFMCILRTTTSQQKTLLDQTLRVMYMTYIQNTKFVSPNSLPGISFMRRSLTEMFLLDENVSYHHAFLYIRQLAIHLRNAITLQKKESTQAVYNWQFLSSLSLWVEVMSASSKQTLQPLLYPVVQVITGALKLVPTAQYFPLRFHLVRMLINITRDTGTFVPVLPFLLEVLNSHDFNKKHTKVTMKPLDFSCILRLSKTQVQENGFKDAVIDSIYNLMLEYLAIESHSIGFPDMTIPAIFQLKDFNKKCKVANYSKKIRQIVEKIEENSKFIQNERKNVSFSLSDRKAVETWETSVKVKGTPLGTFYQSWKKMNDTRQAKQKTGQIDITENLPIIRHKKKAKNENEGPVELLPSDESDMDMNICSDSEGDEVQKPTKKNEKHKKKNQQGKHPKKKAKISNLSDNDNSDAEDVVEDMALSEW